jgi:hypothetical protein
MFDTKTPSASEMVEGARMKTRLAELGQRQRERAEGLKGQHLSISDDQVEAERFQAEANEYASRNPLYSAARAASTNLLVLPLEPNGARPMVPLSEATNDARQLHKWWSSEFKDSNPGVLLGRTGGILALKVDDLAAYARLRQMATVKHYDEDTDSSVIEYREIGGYTVRHVVPSEPFMSCSVIGWGRAYNRAVNEMRKADEQRQPETFWLVWSFPSIVSGQDAFSYRNRRVGQGLTLMAEGALPWNGSVLDGVQVVAANSRPPEIPTWLGAALGHVRLRREIAAAREAYEAIQRRDTAHVTAAIAARRAFEEQEREQADKDRAEAERILLWQLRQHFALHSASSGGEVP